MVAHHYRTVQHLWSHPVHDTGIFINGTRNLLKIHLPILNRSVGNIGNIHLWRKDKKTVHSCNVGTRTDVDTLELRLDVSRIPA